jgi:hypothetical protein
MPNYILQLRTPADGIQNFGAAADNALDLEHPQIGLDHFPMVRALMGIADPVVGVLRGISPDFYAIGPQADPLIPVNTIIDELKNFSGRSFFASESGYSAEINGPFAYGFFINPSGQYGYIDSTFFEMFDPVSSRSASSTVSELKLQDNIASSTARLLLTVLGKPILELIEPAMSMTLRTSGLEFNSIQVVGPQQPAILDADGTLADATRAINEILAERRAAGSIAT